MIEKNSKLLKPVSKRPGAMYGSCKINETRIENYLPFWPIQSALNTSTCEPAEFLVPILRSLTNNEFTVKDSLHFPEEIINQKPDFFMGSLDVDSLFTNITLEETIKICTN